MKYMLRIHVCASTWYVFPRLYSVLHAVAGNTFSDMHHISMENSDSGILAAEMR